MKVEQPFLAVDKHSVLHEHSGSRRVGIARNEEVNGFVAIGEDFDFTAVGVEDGQRERSRQVCRGR